MRANLNAIQTFHNPNELFWIFISRCLPIKKTLGFVSTEAETSVNSRQAEWGEAEMIYLIPPPRRPSLRVTPDTLQFDTILLVSAKMKQSLKRSGDEMWMSTTHCEIICECSISADLLSAWLVSAPVETQPNDDSCYCGQGPKYNTLLKLM